MTRFLLVTILTGGMLCGGCSGDDDAPLFADIQWKVSCRIAGGCSGLPSRDINHLDGEQGHRVNCNLGGTPDSRVLTFQAFQDDPSQDDPPSANAYGIEVRNAVFNAAGSLIAGSGCQVTVQEDNTYVGACGSMPIAPECQDDPDVTSTACTQPCMITNVDLGSDMDGNPQVSGNMICNGLGASADRAREREVHFPGDASMAIAWRIVNCRGL